MYVLSSKELKVYTLLYYGLKCIQVSSSKELKANAGVLGVQSNVVSSSKELKGVKINISILLSF